MSSSELQRASEQREVYLVQVQQRLATRLTPLQAYECIEELREHLNAMARAHEELGVDCCEAMDTSLRDFGSARGLGDSLAEAVFIRSETRAQQIRRLCDVKLSIPVPPLSLVATIVSTSWLTFAAFLAIQIGRVPIYEGQVLGKTYHPVIQDMSELTFTHAVFQRQMMSPLDLAVFAFGTSLVLAPLAWKFKPRNPVKFAFLVAAGLTAFLGVTLYRTYILAGGSDLLEQTAPVLTLTIFLLALGSSYLAVWMRRVIRDIQPRKAPLPDVGRVANG